MRAGATRGGASAAAVAKAAVARVRTVAPAAEGPLTLARASRACRPRCCQEWTASLEAMEAAEPTDQMPSPTSPG